MSKTINIIIGISIAIVTAVGGSILYYDYKKKTKTKTRRDEYNDDTKENNETSKNTYCSSVILIMPASDAKKLMGIKTKISNWFESIIPNIIAIRTMSSDDVYSIEDKLNLIDIITVDWNSDLVYIRLSGLNDEMRSKIFKYHKPTGEETLQIYELKDLLEKFVPMKMSKIEISEEDLDRYFKEI